MLLHLDRKPIHRKIFFLCGSIKNLCLKSEISLKAEKERMNEKCNIRISRCYTLGSFHKFNQWKI